MENVIKRQRYCKYTIEQEKIIIQEYQDGSSMTALSKKYNCDPTTIHNILKAYNIKRRTLSGARRNFIKYEINESVFENIDSPDKSYWLGVMYSDGFISKENKYTNFFGLSVSSKDREWLEKFKKFLEFNGNILDYKVSAGYKIGTPYSRLLIGNNKIVFDLEKNGVVSLKTKKIESIPNIIFKDDFIRGYIDGDGSLRKKYPCFQISGNKSLLIDIAEYLKVPYNIRPDKSIFCLRYNIKQSEYLEKRLYKNAHYYLNRKYFIAQRSFNSPLTLEDVQENSEYQGKS